MKGERKQKFQRTLNRSNQNTIKSRHKMFLTYKKKKELFETLVQRMTLMQMKYERVSNKFEGLDETHCAYVQLLAVGKDIIKLGRIIIKLGKSVLVQQNAELERLKETYASLMGD